MLKLQGYGMLTGIVLAAAVLIWPLIGSFRKALLACLAAVPVLAVALWLFVVHLPPGLSGYGTP